MINDLDYEHSRAKLKAGLLLLIVVFISDDTLTFGTNINQTFIVLRHAIYLFLTLALFFDLNSGKSVILFSYGETIKFLVLLFSFLVTMTFNVDFRAGYLLQLLTVISALLICKSVSFNVFFNYFTKILYFLSVISLFVYAVTYIFPSIILSFPTTVNFGGVEFSNLGVCAVFKDMTFLRNTSIFREPGVFMIYLLIAIVVELYYNIKVKIKHLLVFIVTLITTFSTSGILILVLIILGYLIKIKSLKIILSFIFLTFLISLVFIFIPESFDQFFAKLDTDSSDYVSTLSRISSFSVPLLIFLDNPIFGSGLTNFVKSYSIYSKQLFGIAIEPENSSTNTVVNTFAIFGASFGILMIYSLNRLSRKIIKLTIPSFILFLAFLMMLSSQELRFSLFFNVLLMYGLMNTNVFKSNKI